MKKFWNLFLAAIILCGTAAVLTACGGDDDDKDTPQPKSDTIQKVKVTYTLAVSPTLLKEFTVRAYNSDGSGTSALPDDVEKATWQKTVEVEGSKLPKTFQCYFALAPINRETGATTTENGDVEVDYAMSVIPIKANGVAGEARNFEGRFKGTLKSSETVLKTFAQQANSCTRLTVSVDKDGHIEEIK